MRKRWDGNETVGIVGFDFCYGWRVIVYVIVTRKVVQKSLVPSRSGYETTFRTPDPLSRTYVIRGGAMTRGGAEHETRLVLCTMWGEPRSHAWPGNEASCSHREYTIFPILLLHCHCSATWLDLT